VLLPGRKVTGSGKLPKEKACPLLDFERICRVLLPVLVSWKTYCLEAPIWTRQYPWLQGLHWSFCAEARASGKTSTNKPSAIRGRNFMAFQSSGMPRWKAKSEGHVKA
jgi:hypothetical protein